MMNSFKIVGLDCANCARELEEIIEKIEGVREARVDFMALKVYVDCDDKTLEKVKSACNNFEDVKVVESNSVASGGKCCGEKGHSNGEKCSCGSCSSGGGQEVVKIEGLCCANCARELEEELNKIGGASATVDFMNKKILLSYSSQEVKERAIYAISHFEDVKIVTDEVKRSKGIFKEHKKSILQILISLVLFIPAFTLDLIYGESLQYVRILNYCLFAAAYLTVGYPVLVNTAKNIAKGKIFDENFLMTIASIGAILLGIFAGDGFVEGVAVMLLYQIGELLQSIAVGASRRSIAALVDLKSETATLLDGEIQRTVTPEELKIGDRILIKAGEKIPVDCRVLVGESSLDMKSLNGESMPKDVSCGDELLSGCINISKVLECEVVREYKNSAVSKILELVENSTSQKAKPEKFITKFAKYYTPLVCLAAVVLAALVPTIICGVNNSFIWATYEGWIYTALSFLVISCPCAIVISVPLTYFGGIGRCAKLGILVKGSTCLDSLATAKIAAFDKTGTLTEGSFSIKKYSSESALQIAAAAEKFSSHPIARAFDEFSTKYSAKSVEEIAGRGISCLVEGKKALCGNALLLKESGINFAEVESVSTVIYVAWDNEFVGVIEIDDTVKADAKSSLKELKDGGITECVMLTGDSRERANVVAEQIGLDGTYAALLPDEKLKIATQLKQKGGLIYVGDGINDAPVMTVSDCAVSMGKVGSDAAIEASDIVLISDKLSQIPKGRKIAKGTRRIVFENIVGSIVIKLAIMCLSIAIPTFPLIVAVVADVGVMLVAILNAMRTRFFAR